MQVENKFYVAKPKIPKINLSLKNQKSVSAILPPKVHFGLKTYTKMFLNIFRQRKPLRKALRYFDE